MDNRKKKITTVSILDFLKTGKFGPIKLGDKQSYIERLLGRPDSFYPGSDSNNIYGDTIWFYGTQQEFYFNEDGILYMIFNDFIDFLPEFKSQFLALNDLFFTDKSNNKIDYFNIYRKLIDLKIEFEMFRLIPANSYIFLLSSNCVIFIDNTRNNSGAFEVTSFQISNPVLTWDSKHYMKIHDIRDIK